MTRRRKVALACLVTVAVAGGVALGVKKRGESLRLSALKVAHAVGADGAEDVLYYGRYCSTFREFWTLAQSGPDALWKETYDREDRYQRAFTEREGAEAIPILRKLSLGPDPTDAEIARLATLLGGLTGERRKLLFEPQRLFMRFSRTTPEGRDTAERILHPLSESRATDDRLWYAYLLVGNDSPALPDFFLRSLDDSDPRLVGQSIRFLARRRPDILWNRFPRYLDAPNRVVRESAWDVSWRFLRDNAVVWDRVRAGLWDARPDVRLRAVRYADYLIGDPKATVRIRQLLEDSDREVRFAAVYSVFSHDEARGAVTEATRRAVAARLKDTDLAVRTAALTALSVRKIPSGLPVARQWLRSQEVEERRAAIRALRAYDDRASLPALKRLQSDPEVGMQASNAARAWEPSPLQNLQKVFQFPFVQ